MSKALNKLAKWRMVFAGWQLGTRSLSDPESNAVRDHREVTMILRAETNALVGMLIKKGVFTAEEYQEQLDKEAAYLDATYEEKFPGFKSSDTGMVMDPVKAIDTMAGWRP